MAVVEPRGHSGWVIGRRAAGQQVGAPQGAGRVGARPARAPAGISIHRDTVADDEVQLLGGVSCTTAPRTAFDIGRRLPLDEAVIRVDALLNATAIGVPAVATLAARYPGARSIRQLREVLELVDGEPNLRRRPACDWRSSAAGCRGR